MGTIWKHYKKVYLENQTTPLLLNHYYCGKPCSKRPYQKEFSHSVGFPRLQQTILSFVFCHWDRSRYFVAMLENILNFGDFSKTTLTLSNPIILHLPNSESLNKLERLQTLGMILSWKCTNIEHFQLRKVTVLIKMRKKNTYMHRILSNFYQLMDSSHCCIFYDT